MRLFQTLFFAGVSIVLPRWRAKLTAVYKLRDFSGEQFLGCTEVRFCLYSRISVGGVRKGRRSYLVLCQDSVDFLEREKSEQPQQLSYIGIWCPQEVLNPSISTRTAHGRETD
jgi:hypothetical protein